VAQLLLYFTVDWISVSAEIKMIEKTIRRKQT
jgi:hypothetical protein